MNNLPKILYISEVPVELTFAGSTLVYRLFEEYPSDKLLIIETSKSKSNRKLKKVKYLYYKSLVLEILIKLRLHTLSNILKVILKKQISLKLKRDIARFKPEAIISVTFNLSWLTAYKISKKYKIPLILLLHDDLLTTENYGLKQSFLIKAFKITYLDAHVCFCISPQMEQYYYDLYKKKGSVLFPFRGKNDTTYLIDWEKQNEKKELNFCYAGSSGTTDFLPLLNCLAQILERLGHSLTIFSIINESQIRNLPFLLLPHVKIQNPVHPEDLKAYIYRNVDVNVVVNSFVQEEMFKLNFSSKIVDYTSVNLPVLFWGPSSSGIIGWVLGYEYEGVVTSDNQVILEKMVVALQAKKYREKLGIDLHQIAEETFSYQKNYDLFLSALN